MNYVAYAGGGERRGIAARRPGGRPGSAATASSRRTSTPRSCARSPSVRPRASPGIDVPTLKEQGVNLDFGNWRGVVAPAGMSAGDKKALLDTIDAMAKSGAWKAELKKHNWDDAYLGGDAYAAFIKAENDRISKVLKTWSGEVGARARGARPRRERGRAGPVLPRRRLHGARRGGVRGRRAARVADHRRRRARARRRRLRCQRAARRRVRRRSRRPTVARSPGSPAASSPPSA